jgi:peptide/nickel transport system permease protein
MFLQMPRRDAWLLVAAIAFLGLLFVALFGERIAPYEPIYFVLEHGSDPRPFDPGLVFPFGSDVLGRDLLSLVLIGARATLTIVLLAGVGRVAAGVLVAAIGNWWRPARLMTETVAEFVAAVPATLAALLLMKAFVKTDTTVIVFIGALLLTGWAGPYRVIRTEVDRLGRASFTEGARAIGVSRPRLFWRHQLPHLMPAIAMNLSQQVVASLVLVAELGVLGVLVGAVRAVNVEESLTTVRLGPPASALVPDAPEWGAMLASSRTVEALWTTRWLIFVPALAIALSAIAVAAIGFAIARRYARRDFVQDGRAAAAIGLCVIALFVASVFVPERYAEAREWSAAARSEVRPTGDLATAFDDAGLRTYSAVREIATIERAGPAMVTIGDRSVAEMYPRPIDPLPNTTHAESFVRAGTGGGSVEAPLVFAARGIVPSSRAPVQLFPGLRVNRGPDIGSLIAEYPDDYAGIDVRGKVVLLVRFMGVDAGDLGIVPGPVVSDSIADAITRGAAAVLFVDPELGAYRDRQRPGQRTLVNPYLSLEDEFPPGEVSGVPVVVLDPGAARDLVAPLGLDLGPFLGADVRGIRWERSAARDLAISARVDVPLRERTVAIPSLIAEVPDLPNDERRIVVFAARTFGKEEIEPARADVLAALARFTTTRHAPFIFVDFDASADSRAIRDALRDRRIVLVLVLEDLRGDALRFKTANGELIPALDLFAQQAGARYQVTRRTAQAAEMPAPFPGRKTVVVSAVGDPGDVRADAVAFLGYLAGRLALGAPELPR